MRVIINKLVSANANADADTNADANDWVTTSSGELKIAHFCNVMSIDMTLQKWAIFIMGVYGEIYHF